MCVVQDHPVNPANPVHPVKMPSLPCAKVTFYRINMIIRINMTSCTKPLTAVNMLLLVRSIATTVKGVEATVQLFCQRSNIGAPQNRVVMSRDVPDLYAVEADLIPAQCWTIAQFVFAFACSEQHEASSKLDGRRRISQECSRVALEDFE